MTAAREAEINRLYQIDRELQHHRFRRRAKSRPLDRLILGLDEAERIKAKSLAGTDVADASAQAARSRRRRTNCGILRGISRPSGATPFCYAPAALY